MKIAVLTFSEVKLGGIGTQAWDFARLAQRSGHEAELVNIEPRQFTDLIEGKPKLETAFAPTENGRSLKLKSNRLGTGNAKQRGIALDYLNRVDCCIWVGVAPHFQAEDEQVDMFAERPKDEADQEAFYTALLKNGKRHIAFGTDTFLEEYYPWMRRQLKHFSGRFAFAEPYAKVLSQPDAKFTVLPIAPLSAWEQRGIATKPSARPRKIFWPHQWRGWKNVEMFLELSQRLAVPEITMYAAQTMGGEITACLFRKTELYKAAVKSDDYTTQNNPEGKLVLHGFRPHAAIIQEYKDNATCPDLTGVSKKTRQPNSYVGNYQCATLEAMLLGCALIKFNTTVAPYNAIPKDAILPLEPGKEDYAPDINAYLSDLSAADRAAARAYEWLCDVGEPERCFRTMLNGGAS